MAKKFNELFSIIYFKGESIRAYLKRFNEVMLQVKNLLELMAIKALISGGSITPYGNVFMHYLIQIFLM
jgi:hypothetical protein